MTRTFRRFLVLRAAFCGLLAVSAAVCSQAQHARGKQLYTNCSSCHGDKGQGMKLLDAPALAGLSEAHIEAQFAKFKTGLRGGVVEDHTGLQMRPMTLTLKTPEDIQAVAEYLASLPAPNPEPTLAEGDAERGKALYASCQACHGAKGEGNDQLNAPSLAFQHDWYLALQLHKFKDGVRGSDPADITGSQMRPMAMTLADDQAIKDVVAYILTLSE